MIGLIVYILGAFACIVLILFLMCPPVIRTSKEKRERQRLDREMAKRHLAPNLFKRKDRKPG